MKPQLENDESTSLYEKVKLTDEEIWNFAAFKNLGPEELDHLRKTIFNLSFLLLKLNTNESA